MFGFRKLAYTLLSRHFWVGIGVGFFCASLFFASQVLASTVDINTTGQSTSSFGDFTSTYWVNIPSGVVSGDILDEIVLKNQYTNKDFQIFMYATGNTTNVLATSTYVSHASAFDSVYTFNFPTTTINCKLGCDFKVIGSNSSWAYQNTATQTITTISPNAGQKPLIKITSSITPVAESPLLNYSFTLGNVASTSCVGSSTSSQCTHYYYPNFTPVTPVNLFVLFITFFISFTGTAFIIRKLT